MGGALHEMARVADRWPRTITYTLLVSGLTLFADDLPQLAVPLLLVAFMFDAAASVTTYRTNERRKR